VAFPDPPGLPLAWFIPAASKRDVATGFFVIARWAAEAFPDPDPPGLPLAWFIPAASKRDAATGFFVMARWAADATAAPDVGSGDASCGSECAAPAPPPPMRERRSGLEVKYLQERASEDRRCGP
jgi:hypothetical protein